mmetsp:Transcript_9210/g.15714  ORF Transcript_9210/g.15714 Transcript_9210/m.15714 type:complete len:439 (+) Transcript_9210:49-1365(+)
MPPGERLPAGWASAVGMGGSEVETLKNQLREAQMANNDVLAQMKATESSWRKCIEEAEQKEAQARQELERCKAKFEKWRPPKSPELSRLLHKLKRNVAREMRDAQQGFVIQKVTEKHGKTEVRRVAVCPHTQILKWCHANESFGPTAKTLDLRLVQKLEFGQAARAAKIIPEASPWHCFSLVTAERSYDFIASNENSTRCFVLSISRLCEGKAEGVFRTRHDFEVTKGWARLKLGCKRRGSSITQDFLLALQKVGEKLPKAAPMQTDEAYSKPMDIFDFCNEPKDEPRERIISTGSNIQSFSSAGGATPKNATPNGSFKPLERLASATDDLGANARGFMAWMTPFGSSGAVWPKAGETWVFTGAVEHVDLYRSAEGTEWVNEMTCRSQSERRMVTIISALPQQNMVEIRGTDKLKFVKGWARMVDDNGNWLLEKAPMK